MTDHAAVPAATAPRPRRQSTVSRRVRKGAVGALWALAGILLGLLMWELVKWVGTLVSLPFNTNDLSMPHVWTMFSGAWQPEVRGSDTTVLQAVLQSAAYSLLIALGGTVPFMSFVAEYYATKDVKHRLAAVQEGAPEVS